MTRAARRDPDVVGTLVGGKYRVARLLGRGGMGAVYEARHEFVGRRFAIKFLLPELAMRRDVLTRFRREAQAAGALENENIAAVTDFGVADDGSSYIVMEYLQGEDLARLLARSGPLPVARAVSAVIQACRGLVAAHAANIVHRDLKPANLFVAKRGDGTDLIKVLDFGIAKLRLDEPTGTSTSTGVALGTPHYMPPEQARGERDLDHRADIYALGVILYELLSGKKPHDGDGYNAILFQILTQASVRIESLRARLPAGLGDVVHKAMASDPPSRYQSATALIDALRPYAGSALPTNGSSTQRLAAASDYRPAALHTDTETSAPASLESRERITRTGPGWNSGRKWLWIAAALTLFAGVTLSLGARHAWKVDADSDAAEPAGPKVSAASPPAPAHPTETRVLATAVAPPAPTASVSARAKAAASVDTSPPPPRRASAMPASRPVPTAARNSPMRTREDLYAP